MSKLSYETRKWWEVVIFTIEINTVKRNQSILCFNRGKLSQSYCFAFNISVAKNFSKFHGNYLWWSHFLVKVQTLGK